MDILRYLSESFWEWLGSLPIEFIALFSRMALILLLMICFGSTVKEIYQKGLRHILPLQITSVFLAVIIGLITKFGFIENMSDNFRCSLLLVAFSCCAILPFITVRYVIRQRGRQYIAWKVIYGIEALLFLIQIIVCI